MKAMKKFAAIVLAVMMVLAMSTTAFAATSGSITINNATIGERYAGYKIFDATVAGDNIAYTIKTSSQFYDAISDSDGPFTLARIGDTDTYTVAVKGGTTDQEVLDFVAALTVTASPDLTEKTATDTQVKWESVPYGYYFITSSLGATVSVTNADSNVTIVDKNLKPGWSEPEEQPDAQPGKNVSNSVDGPFSEAISASQGDTIYYSIAAFAPKYNGKMIVNEYAFRDVPYPGVKVDLSSLTVRVNGVLLSSGQYTLTPNVDGGEGFEIKVPVYGNATYPENATITILYSAEVIGEYSYDRKNEATMTWTEFEPSTDDPATPAAPSAPAAPADGPEKSTTHTYVYGFDLQKYKNEVDGGNELDGAKFKLYDAPTGGNEIQLIKTDDGYVVPDSAQKTAVPTYVDIEAGFAQIRGLKEGTYYLEEVEAPDGYNQLTSRVMVTVGKTQDFDSNGINDDTVKVINNAGVMLPETGGIGTTIFYVVGGLLMAGAAVLLITKKKMSASND